MRSLHSVSSQHGDLPDIVDPLHYPGTSSSQQQQSRRTSSTLSTTNQDPASIPSAILIDLNDEPNIDKGWAWVVMVASLLMIVIVEGITFSTGVLIQELLEEFGQTESKTSLVASVLSGFYLGAGERYIYLITHLKELFMLLPPVESW